jgi:hypothetical protein
MPTQSYSTRRLIEEKRGQNYFSGQRSAKADILWSCHALCDRSNSSDPFSSPEIRDRQHLAIAGHAMLESVASRSRLAFVGLWTSGLMCIQFVRSQTFVTNHVSLRFFRLPITHYQRYQPIQPGLCHGIIGAKFEKTRGRLGFLWRQRDFPGTAPSRRPPSAAFSARLDSHRVECDCPSCSPLHPCPRCVQVPPSKGGIQGGSPHM